MVGTLIISVCIVAVITFVGAAGVALGYVIVGIVIVALVACGVWAALEPKKPDK